MLAERWQLLPWDMERLTPREFSRITKLVAEESERAKKEQREARRASRGGRRRP